MYVPSSSSLVPRLSSARVQLLHVATFEPPKNKGAKVDNYCTLAGGEPGDEANPAGQVEVVHVQNRSRHDFHL